MKSTSEYIKLLRQFKEQNADKYGITKLGLFGSVARGEQMKIVMWIYIWKVSHIVYLLWLISKKSCKNS